MCTHVNVGSYACTRGRHVCIHLRTRVCMNKRQNDKHNHAQHHHWYTCTGTCVLSSVRTPQLLYQHQRLRTRVLSRLRLLLLALRTRVRTRVRTRLHMYERVQVYHTAPCYLQPTHNGHSSTTPVRDGRGLIQRVLGRRQVVLTVPDDSQRPSPTLPSILPGLEPRDSNITTTDCSFPRLVPVCTHLHSHSSP
jgi:hypothetical protein